MTERRVLVAGVGMTRFVTPRNSPEYDLLGKSAILDALADAGLERSSVQRAYAGYVYGDSTAGQRVLYDAGVAGVPIVNVNNNCATGATALWLAYDAVASGVCDCVLAVGFEKMPSGALGAIHGDRAHPLERFVDRMTSLQQYVPTAPLAAQFFGGAGREHQERYGTRADTFAGISARSRSHAASNPRAVFREPLTVVEVLESPPVYGPLTRLQCCPPTCGAAAAVLVSEVFARRHVISRAIHLRSIALVTDAEDTFSGGMMDLVGARMTRRAVAEASRLAGVDPGDAEVVELHDCFTTNELISYEALGLAEAGEAEKLFRDGDTTYGGRHVINPSGGLMAKGHPLGATGLAQCFELVSQLRGDAGARQVDGARLGLQHNIGLGGACVVAIYERPSLN